MPDILLARSPLVSPTKSGDRIAEGSSVILRERSRAVIHHLEGLRQGSSVPDLPSVGKSIGSDKSRLLGIGPATWLLVADGAAPPSLEFEISVDQSHAWTRLSISGPASRPLLAKGCVLDLDPKQFPSGACAATGIARMRVVLWRADDDMRYDLLVGRSYAVSLWEWLMEAALEFGCEEVAT